MKTKHIIAAVAALMPIVYMQSAKAQDLSAMATLACEATLCLSSGEQPTECTPSLNKYFSIVFTKPWKTIQARKNFLKLCPDVTEADANQAAAQSVQQDEGSSAAADETEAATPEDTATSTQPPREQIQAALNSLTPAWTAQAQQSVAARQVLESCIAQQGTVETGHCQAERAEYDAKRQPAITLRDEITRLESMLANSAR